MKRVFTVMVAGAVACSLFAGCSSKQTTTTTPSQSETTTTAPSQTTPPTTLPQQTQAPGAALEALESVWNLFADDEKFWVVGGDYEHAVDNAPGVVDLTATDYLSASLLIPEAEQGKITEAASMMHAMNGNNFTCGVYKVDDVQAFADTMHTVIGSHQWVCGMPEQLKILNLGGGYVMIAFGIADAMDPFFQKLETVHPQAAVLVDEPVV